MSGAGFRAGAQHSQTLAPLFTMVPGLKVVMPSNAYDAKGLLIQAIRDDDPVIFLESKVLYDTEAEVPDEAYRVPFGEANLIREGNDVTLVAFGAMVPRAIAAADRLAKDGIHADVLDPRTPSPLDVDSILESVQRPASWSSSTRARHAARWRPTSPRSSRNAASKRSRRRSARSPVRTRQYRSRPVWRTPMYRARLE